MMQPRPNRPTLVQRGLNGDPPALKPIDKAARYGFFAGWLLGMADLVGGIIPLIAPAGLIFAVIGVLLFTNHGGFRDRMRVREERSLNYKLTELRTATKFGGALLTIVGLGWFAMGVGGAIGAI
jgi:hypothetical protein